MIRRGTEPLLSPLTTLALIRWAGLVAGVLLVGSGVSCCVDGEWGSGLPLLLAGIALLSLPRKRRRALVSSQAAQQWPLPRVREALTTAGAAEVPRTERVRVLRRIDARLGLAEATDLVDRAAEVEAPGR